MRSNPRRSHPYVRTHPLTHAIYRRHILYIYMRWISRDARSQHTFVSSARIAISHLQSQTHTHIHMHNLYLSSGPRFFCCSSRPRLARPRHITNRRQVAMELYFPYKWQFLSILLIYLLYMYIYYIFVFPQSTFAIYLNPKRPEFAWRKSRAKSTCDDVKQAAQYIYQFDASFAYIH